MRGTASCLAHSGPETSPEREQKRQISLEPSNGNPGSQRGLSGLVVGDAVASCISRRPRMTLATQKSVVDPINALQPNQIHIQCRLRLPGQKMSSVRRTKVGNWEMVGAAPAAGCLQQSATTANLEESCRNCAKLQWTEHAGRRSGEARGWSCESKASSSGDDTGLTVPDSD
jgi:hypothetical protein